MFRLGIVAHGVVKVYRVCVSAVSDLDQESCRQKVHEPVARARLAQMKKRIVAPGAFLNDIRSAKIVSRRLQRELRVLLGAKHDGIKLKQSRKSQIWKVNSTLFALRLDLVLPSC